MMVRWEDYILSSWDGMFSGAKLVFWVFFLGCNWVYISSAGCTVFFWLLAVHIDTCHAASSILAMANNFPAPIVTKGSGCHGRMSKAEDTDCPNIPMWLWLTVQNMLAISVKASGEIWDIADVENTCVFASFCPLALWHMVYSYIVWEICKWRRLETTKAPSSGTCHYLVGYKSCSWRTVATSALRPILSIHVPFWKRLCESQWPGITRRADVRR